MHKTILAFCSMVLGITCFMTRTISCNSIFNEYSLMSLVHGTSNQVIRIGQWRTFYSAVPAPKDELLLRGIVGTRGTQLFRSCMYSTY